MPRLDAGSKIAFGAGGRIAERGERPESVVMLAPSLDLDLGLVERRKLLNRQQFVTKFGIKALAISVLPWRSRLDVERRHADPAEP